MIDNWVKKGLVFTVILLFIGVSFQPVFGLKEKESLVNNKKEPSNQSSGPDLRILSVHISTQYWGENYFRVNVVGVDAINLGDDVVDKVFIFTSCIYRWGKKLNGGEGGGATLDWGHSEIRSVDGTYLRYFPSGIYRLSFYIGFCDVQDTNIIDNSFDRYFFVFNFFGKHLIFPHVINEWS